MKLCNKCKVNKDESNFYKDKRTKKDGLYGHCKKCHIKMEMNWSRNNKEKVNELSKKWSKNNPEKIRLKRINYRSNPENMKKENQWNATYKARNKHKINAINAARRAAKLKATPPWLTESMKIDINFFYYIRENMKNPKKWHVDHIDPLLGETFRGLHVPWNLRVIPAFDNMSKHNKLS